MLKRLARYARRYPLVDHAIDHARARMTARKHPEGIVPTAPSRIIVEPTNGCNLKCLYCGNKDMLRKATYLDLGIYEQLLDQMVEAKIPRLTLHTIGEPTLHPRIARMLSMAVERERCVVMSTNGTRLREGLAREIVEASPDMINISVDTPDQETLDILRPGLKLDELLENMRTFKRIRDEEGRVRESPWGPVRLPTITLTCVITKYFTREAEGRFFELFGDLVDDFAFQFANNHGSYVREDDSAPRRPLPEGLRKRLYGAVRTPCVFLWDTLSLLSNGTVSACRFEFDARVDVGRFPEQSLMELWRGEEMKRLRRAHMKFDFEGLDQCRDCSTMLYSSRVDHQVVTQRIIERNGFRPARTGWLSSDPRQTT